MPVMAAVPEDSPLMIAWSRYNQHRTRNWSFDTKALAEAKFDSLPVDYDDWR